MTTLGSLALSAWIALGAGQDAASSGPRSDLPADLDAQIERAIREEVARALPPPPPARSARTYFAAGELYGEITVTDWYNTVLILPDYAEILQPIKGFGVPRGGSSGSPSFDVVTRRYWWE